MRIGLVTLALTVGGLDVPVTVTASVTVVVYSVVVALVSRGTWPWRALTWISSLAMIR